MERDLLIDLLGWKRRKRSPLLVRGARQVGKSYLVEEFGRGHFESVVVVNFEREGRAADCFETLDPKEMIRKLGVLTNAKIEAGKTLLFLDEIQQCPRAITALRYFKEQMPDLHVVGAGSLLEFTLQDSSFSFPVGRVEFLYLRPLSFSEFLRATGRDQLHAQLAKVTLTEPPDTLLHDLALDSMRSYLLVGGMPAVVQRFIETNSYVECRHMQSQLLETYRSDFGKYARVAQHRYLRAFFDQAPQVVGHHFQYVKIDPEARSRDLRTALDQLESAGLLYRVRATAANGLPSSAEANDKKFKLLMLDVGLLQSGHQIDAQLMWEQDLLQINSGSLAEQFVGQELLAYSPSYENTRLHFWERQKRSATAEVDYVVPVDSQVVPVEVKAGRTGRLRSLQQFISRKRAPLGVRVSQHPLEMEKKVLSVPLYLIEQLPRLVMEALAFG